MHAMRILTLVSQIFLPKIVCVYSEREEYLPNIFQTVHGALKRIFTVIHIDVGVILFCFIAMHILKHQMYVAMLCYF